MLLELNLGNGSLSIAVCENRKCLYQFKTFADKLKSENEYQELISQLLFYKGIDPKTLEGSILSSVVPSLNKRIIKAVEEITSHKCLMISRELKSGLAIKIDSPSELGSDLICGGIGAINTYRDDCIIVDIGTATKIYLVTKNKEYLGGALAPGLRPSSETLWNSTAQLMEIDPSPTEKFIGKNTKDCMSIGIIYGHTYLIRGLVDSIQKEYGKPVKKIVTGEDGEILAEHLGKEYTFNRNLVFEGLYDIYVHNTKKAVNN